MCGKGLNQALGSFVVCRGGVLGQDNSEPNLAPFNSMAYKSMLVFALIGKQSGESSINREHL